MSVICLTFDYSMFKQLMTNIVQNLSVKCLSFAQLFKVLDNYSYTLTVWSWTCKLPVSTLFVKCMLLLVKFYSNLYNEYQNVLGNFDRYHLQLQGHPFHYDVLCGSRVILEGGWWGGSSVRPRANPWEEGMAAGRVREGLTWKACRELPLKVLQTKFYKVRIGLTVLRTIFDCF